MRTPTSVETLLGVEMQWSVLIAVVTATLYATFAIADANTVAPTKIVHTAAVMNAEHVLPTGRITYIQKGENYFTTEAEFGKLTTNDWDLHVHYKFALCSAYELAQKLGKNGVFFWDNNVIFVSKKDEADTLQARFALEGKKARYWPVVEEAQGLARAGYPCRPFSDPVSFASAGNTKKGTNERHSPGTTFSDCDLCPKMVSIPGGSFNMGQSTIKFAPSEEWPVHSVTIPQFAMAQTEITRGQFAAFVRETNYPVQDQCTIFWIGPSGNVIADNRSNHSWTTVGFTQDDHHPVVCVSWEDAQAYVQWLAKITGKPYRLPSEAEWEYAARGGTPTNQFWDATKLDSCGFANVRDTSFKPSAAKVYNPVKVFECDDGVVYTSPGGSFKPNQFGLFDMLGNVWEWVQDRWHDNYLGAPVDGSAWTTSNRDIRVFRGTSWVDALPIQALVTSRGRKMLGPRANILGFRVALTE